MAEARSPKVSELIQRRAAGMPGAGTSFSACAAAIGLCRPAQVESGLRVKVDASDLVQETILEAYRDFDRFQGRSEQEWIAWLKRILAHDVADFVAIVSRHGQAASPPGSAAGGDPPATSIDPRSPQPAAPG